VGFRSIASGDSADGAGEVPRTQRAGADRVDDFYGRREKILAEARAASASNNDATSGEAGAVVALPRPLTR
jgi:hypothetical protein